jgi:hypothetical protein
MSLTKRQLTVLILFTVIAAVTLMAASLSNLELRPGRIVPGGMILDPGGSTVSPWTWFLEKYQAVLKLVLLFSPIAVIGCILTPKGRRMLLVFAVIIVFIFLFRHITFRNLALELPQMEIQGQLEFKPPPDNSGTESLPVPPAWLVFTVSFLVSTFILCISVFLWKRFRPRPSPLKQMAIEVKKTIEDLRDGADLREGVIRCYYEMSRVINEQRGIKRRQAMTVREFEDQLEKAGLPGVHIELLTRLFEKVRYGAKDLDESEEQEALSCLNNILKACEDWK